MTGTFSRSSSIPERPFALRMRPCDGPMSFLERGRSIRFGSKRKHAPVFGSLPQWRVGGLRVGSCRGIGSLKRRHSDEPIPFRDVPLAAPGSERSYPQTRPPRSGSAQHLGAAGSFSASAADGKQAESKAEKNFETEITSVRVIGSRGAGRQLQTPNSKHITGTRSVPAWRDPVRHVAILRIGLWACVLVVPLALIARPIRAIPFSWRLIDCSLGLFGATPESKRTHAGRVRQSL